MTKLNCSFPWMKSTQKLPKCGSDHKIQNLVNLANKANIKNPDLMKELKDFGCSVPNCHDTNWIVSSWQKAGMENLSDVNIITLNFPSSSKVNFRKKQSFYLVVIPFSGFAN